jgi:hypothetical protein
MGSTKKHAEQDAARRALERLETAEANGTEARDDEMEEQAKQ